MRNVILRRFRNDCRTWYNSGRNGVCHPARKNAYRRLRERHDLERRIVPRLRQIDAILAGVEEEIKEKLRMQYRTHACGYPVAITHTWNGMIFVPRFVDNDKESETTGQEIETCPQCGETLLPGDLERVEARAMRQAA